MVFRTQVTHDDGTIETLQVSSQQIICSKLTFVSPNSEIPFNPLEKETVI